uniref:Uncharacterized protein n=1 Tax=Cacopsylla melanoneura TaxID=428564 RepID=A0A8D8TW01_9HEMI
MFPPQILYLYLSFTILSMFLFFASYFGLVSASKPTTNFSSFNTSCFYLLRRVFVLHFQFHSFLFQFLHCFAPPQIPSSVLIPIFSSTFHLDNSQLPFFCS